MTPRIDIHPTIDFHEQLAAALPARRDEIERALRTANDAMRRQHMTLSQDKPLEVALSALLLSPRDVAQLQNLAESLAAIVERVVDLVLDRPELLDRVFPESQRVAPFFARTRGVPSWQILARYDAAVTPDGVPKIMELNTACPGALLISEAMSQVTRHGLDPMHQDIVDLDTAQTGTVDPKQIGEALLAIEQRSGIERGTIGILHDENELSFEQEQFVDVFRAHGREAIIADARDLELRDGRLVVGEHYLSLICNKFRISTPDSPNHCWKRGFESRYAPFLAAQRNGHVVSVNNLVAMSLAENKAILALLRDASIQSELTDDQRSLVDRHVLWTARLEPGSVSYDGEQVDLLPLVRKNRERFVIKPTSEGRGFGVVIGKFCTPSQWNEACQVDPRMPKVVQEFTETLTLPVLCDRDQTVAARTMYVTLGLATLCGRYAGLVSRISAHPVTNVAREGFGQAVFVQPDA